MTNGGALVGTDAGDEQNVDQDRLDRLVARIRADLPPDTWEPWPGGWPGEVEAALLDTVLGIQARYGQSFNGVRGAISRYREACDGGPLDDLPRLADQDPAALAGVLGNHQQASKLLKTEIIATAAGNLSKAGVRQASDLDTSFEPHQHAFTMTRGLNWVTWEYFGMLLGNPGVKIDTWVSKFVSDTLNTYSIGRTAARDLLIAAAEEIGVSPTDLDHAIWSYQRANW